MNEFSQFKKQNKQVSLNSLGWKGGGPLLIGDGQVVASWLDGWLTEWLAVVVLTRPTAKLEPELWGVL